MKAQRVERGLNGERWSGTGMMLASGVTHFIPSQMRHSHLTPNMDRLASGQEKG